MTFTLGQRNDALRLQQVRLSAPRWASPPLGRPKQRSPRPLTACFLCTASDPAARRPLRSTDQPGNVGVVAMQIQGAPAAMESKWAREETHLNEEGRPGMFDVRPPNFDDEDVDLTGWKEKGSEQHPRPVHRHPASFRKLALSFRWRLLSLSLR
jgi:hypothetical protein